VHSQIAHCLSLLQTYRDMQMLSTSESCACYTSKTNVQSMNITSTRELKKIICLHSKIKIKLRNFKISGGALFDQLELCLPFNLGMSFIVQCKI